MGVEDRHIKFALAAGTYSIYDFIAKVKVAILQRRKKREAPQIKDIKLTIPDHYTCYCAWYSRQIS